MFLSAVMPAYNEEAAIESVIREHLRYLESIAPRLQDWELVCVDDASRDRTSEILESLSRGEPKLRVIRHKTNQGIFAAFSTCYKEARGTHIFATGSDGQWPPENLGLLLDAVDGGAQLAVGVRNNRREVYTFLRRVISFGFNSLPPLLFGVRVQDAGSCKLGVREVFRFDLVSRSPFFEAERIIRASREGYRVDFVPIRFATRQGGKASGGSWKNVRSSLQDMMRCLRVYGFR
jgi:glycosyltransferase involved in cell wall biosynthesis